MNKKYILIAAIFISMAFSLINNRGSAIENARFNLKLYEKGKETDAITASLRQYNGYSASFYNSGGFLGGLGDIPAAPLLKRQIFKDITMLQRDGLVLVFDKDSLKVKKIGFLNKDLATAETEEVWAISLQDLKTRRPIFNTKAVEIKVRYLLHKEPFLTEKERWIVHIVDVYPKNEEIPGPNIKPVL